MQAENKPVTTPEMALAGRLYMVNLPGVAIAIVMGILFCWTIIAPVCAGLGLLAHRGYTRIAYKPELRKEIRMRWWVYSILLNVVFVGCSLWLMISDLEPWSYDFNWFVGFILYQLFYLLTSIKGAMLNKEAEA